MDLELYCTLVPLLPFEDSAAAGRIEALLLHIASEGYSGVEIQISQLLVIGKARFIAALKAAGLRFIGKVYSSGGPGACPHAAGFAASHPPGGRGVAEHVAVWSASVRECCEPVELRELLVSISSQSGRDFFHRGDGAEARVFFQAALALQCALRITIHHETHRHRLLFSPFFAVEAVACYPTLRLLGDLSHYAVVCEASCGEAELEDCVSAIVHRIGHVHLRVGYSEGPQIQDPRLPEGASQLAGHARWWAAVWLAARKRGDKAVTATPEFLLPPYARVGDDVTGANAYMARYARQLFNATKEEDPLAAVESFILKGLA